MAQPPVLFALLCRLTKMLARMRAWRNVLAAAFPGQRIRRRRVPGTHTVGAGVDAVLPARSGALLEP